MLSNNNCNVISGVLLLLAMSADRYMAATHPIKSMKYRNQKVALRVVMWTYAISIVYNIPYGVTTRELYGKICTALVTDDIWSRMYSYINIIVNSLVPFTMLMYFNVAILKVIRKRRLNKRNGPVSYSYILLKVKDKVNPSILQK